MKIRVSIPKQTLTLEDSSGVLRSYPVSTARNGAGSEEGSLKTPTGRFRVCEKIGHRAPAGTWFQSRLPVGPAGEEYQDNDLVLSRILWLDGLDIDNANTKSRFIYIHGTNHEPLLGTPCSHGCVRMANQDIIDLYDLVEEGIEVEITG